MDYSMKGKQEYDQLIENYIDESSFLYNLLGDEYKNSYRHLVTALLNEVLPFMSMFIRYYTDHGAPHSKEVAKLMDNIARHVEPSIEPEEAFILLASAWLHDIGLMNNTDPVTGLILDDKEIRDKHGEMSSHIIDKFQDRLFINNDAMHDFIINEIMNICKMHDSKDTKWFKINEPYDSKIRTSLLIAILRLSDLLDLRKNRAPGLTREIVKIPTESALHWQIYKIICSNNNIIQFIDPNTLKIKIDGFISGDDERYFKESLFFYKIKQIEEEITKTKNIFKKVNIIIQDKASYKLKIGNQHNPPLPLQSAEELFEDAKNLYIKSEFQKLEKSKENSYLMSDYCLDAVENIKNKSIRKEWRDRAKEYFKKIMESSDGFPITGFFHVRRKYNDLKLKSAILYNQNEKLFLNDMEKINRSIYYLLGSKSLNIENILGPLILLRYGLTPYRQELKRAVIYISKSIISKKCENKINLNFAHNECNLCTGRALSVLSYLRQFEPLFYTSDVNEVNSQIEGMFKWIETQECNKYSTIKNKPLVIKSPRYTSSILEGLLDLYFFNKGLIEPVLIEKLIKKVATVWWDKISNIEIDKLEERPSIIYGRFFRSIYLYVCQFKDQNILQEFRNKKDFWADHINIFEKESISSKFEGWDLTTCWDIWKDDYEMRQLSMKISASIRKQASESEIWDKNGTWGGNDSSTKNIIESWLFYWEHYWRLKEAEKKEKHDE